MRLYGDPEGAARHATSTVYHARAAAGDPIVLHDAIVVTIDKLVVIRDEIQAHMDGAEPTTAAPGSQDKVEELRRRYERGDSLFIDGDADGVGPADGLAG